MRPIDADKVDNKLSKKIKLDMPEYNAGIIDAGYAIADEPTIAPEEYLQEIPEEAIKAAVRCKTCKRWEANRTGWSYCRQTGDYTGENGLCKYWARKEK